MIELGDIISPKSHPLQVWLLILLLAPIASFLLSNLLKKLAPVLSTGIIGLTTILSICLAFNHWQIEPTLIKGNWFKIGTSQLTYAMMIDQLMLIMTVVVNFISFLVHFFSIEYMRKDKRRPLYFAFLGVFTFSIMGIVLFHDLLLMFVFWELVGLSSYLLIGFWFEKKSASKAANKAFIVNRIGDLGFITGLMILFTQFQTFDLEAIKTLMVMSDIEDGNWITRFMVAGQEVTSSLDGRWLSALGIALFCGAVGKSAQFPLQIWLPDAMEGPTPVSALIHAATMVAAGVYLLARIFIILDAQALEVVAVVGAITAFMAAIAALSQFEIKKVLAYSTISQLGYMVMAMGVGAYTAGLFHLFTHAFFKAGLFLSAGIIIHQLHKLETEETKFDSQDMRVMGGLRKKLPITFFAFLFCSLALVGLPGFSGFISKDAILLDLAVWSDIKAGGFYIPEVLAFATVLFTSFYTFRMIFLVFFGEFRLPRITGADDIGDKLKEGNLNLIIPALILAVLSLSFAFIGFGFNAEDSWIADALPTPVYLIPTSYAAQSLVDIGEEVFKNLSSLVTLIATGLALIGIIIAYVAYRPNAKLEQSFIERREPKGMFGQVSFYNWYLDTFYRKAILRFFMLFSKSSDWFDRKVIDGMVDLISKVTVVAAHLSKWFDRYFIDGLVNLSANVVGRVGQATRSIQGGNVQLYIALSFVFIILLMLYLVF